MATLETAPRRARSVRIQSPRRQAGDTPSTGRLYDAISCLCVPLIVVDDLELPFLTTCVDSKRMR